MDASSASRAEDHRLPEAVSAHHAWAERELYVRFERRVTVLAARRGVPPTMIEDVVQETLMGVLTALREGRLEDDHRLAAFVYGTARNVISNIWRRHSLSAWPEAVEDPDVYAGNGPDPLVQLLSREQRRAVASCLESMRPEDREVLRLAFFEGLPPREIADALGVAPNVARQRKWRAQQRFAEIWRDTRHH